MANVFELIQTFDSPELGISIDENIVTFTKNNKSYSIGLKQKKNTLELQYVDKNNLDNMHFVEILNTQGFNNVNQIPDLIDFVRELNVNHYCICCHNKLDFQSDCYISCSLEDCLYKYEEIIVGNKVLEKVKDDPLICEFLIQSAIDAVQSGRENDIFEPFPTYFMKQDVKLKRGKMSKLEGQNYDHLKDFDRIKALINNFDINTFIKLCENYKTDQDLSKNIGRDLYILIRFILMSCKVDIQKNDDVLGIQSEHFTIYKIVHPSDKEEEFKGLVGGEKTGFLFHGSRWANFYSILRNGLKNCSNSKLMTAGAAYGAGIYLSGDINVSYGYGLSGHKSIVGVFEVINKDKYSKSGHQVYVVDDDRMLIQRYLLIIPSKNAGYLTEINNMFNKKIYVEKSNAEVKYNQKSIAKIIREYKQIMKLKDTLPFRIEVNPEMPFTWHIFIHKFDEKYPIAQDMKKFKVKEIEMEIRFPPTYPFSPPFIRVVQPRFMRLTGHIGGASGAICNQILSEKNWVATCTIESLITIIISEIIEGDGRLDPQTYHIPYSYDEAREGFMRIMKSHDWL